MKWGSVLLCCLVLGCAAETHNEQLDRLHEANLEGVEALQARLCECFYELWGFASPQTCMEAQPPVTVSRCERQALASEPERYEDFLRCRIAENEYQLECLADCPATPEPCLSTGEPSDTCASMLSDAQRQAWEACLAQRDGG